MNEEIERLIFDLEGCCGMFDYMLTPLENSLLVSYIKDLQQENKQLKEKYENAVADYESEKSKNHNTIEYIKNNSAFINDDEYEVFNKKELLEILKGDNNE